MFYISKVYLIFSKMITELLCELTEAERTIHRFRSIPSSTHDTSLFPSNAGFNPISSVWARGRDWQAYLPFKDSHCHFINFFLSHPAH